MDFGVSLITDIKAARQFAESEEHFIRVMMATPLPPKTMKDFYSL